MNSVCIIGNLVADPEFKQVNENFSISEFRLAINMKRSSNGQTKEETIFVSVKCFNAVAETTSKFLNKGSKVGVVGRLAYDEWENSEGQKNSKVYVIGNSVEFLTPKPESTSSNQTQPTKKIAKKVVKKPTQEEDLFEEEDPFS